MNDLTRCLYEFVCEKHMGALSRELNGMVRG